jgi:hypothetical protein
MQRKLGCVKSLHRRAGGQVSTILELIDPRTLLTTDDEIAAALATLAAFDAGGGVLPAGVSNARMWESLRIKEACIHPVTGEKLFWMGRMSAFVPMVREHWPRAASLGPRFDCQSFVRALNLAHRVQCDQPVR